MQDVLNAVAELARQAGAMVRDEFYRPGGPRGWGDKADVDDEIEAMLRPQLEALLPGCAVLGEELGHSSGSDDSPYCWLVDPHDGTSAFLRGYRGSSVSIGLLKNNQPVLGVVYAPLYPNDTGDLIYGAPGLGLWRNGARWEAPLRSHPLGPNDIVAISQDADCQAEANMSFVQPARYLALPSIAYRLALAAVGDVRVGHSLVHLSAHDVGAGHALLLAAGKVLAPWEGPSDSVTYTPDLREGRVVGGDLAAVNELKERPRGPMFTNPKSSHLSRRPKDRRWRADKNLSLNRAQGCLVGQLAGDSLGSLVEFKTAESIAILYPEGPSALADGGVWNTLAGQPTDDSEMALALARQLVADQGFQAHRVLRAYKTWIDSRPFDLGSTTRQALSHDRPNPESQANGSLMRCSPLGLAFSPEQLQQIATDDSALTHPHPLCGECCRVFTQTISRGVSGQSVRQAFEAALESSTGEVQEMLLAAQQAPPQEFLHQMGWIRIAFHNAFHWLYRESPLSEALIWTVRQGGDTDTNGAILGALLGAFQGLEAIPPQWRMSVVSCRPDRSNPQSHQPRPRTYWPADALNLAELLLEVRAKNSLSGPS